MDEKIKIIGKGVQLNVDGAEGYFPAKFIVNAVGKQLPKKPKKIDSGWFYTCPNCNKIVKKYEQSHGKIKIPYCKWCGQAWDWSNEDGKI